VVSREDVATERQGNDDEHQHFFVVLDRLENNKLAIKEGEAVLANLVSVGGVESGDVRLREGRSRRQTVK
jgi:hypothetical protein